MHDKNFLIERSWEMKQSTPFGWSWEYNAFTYNEKGYILEVNAKKLYEYNPEYNVWDAISLYPGVRDERNLFIVAGDKVLKMGGIDYYGPSNDFWEYDFVNETWTKKK
jgi:hypothetical protein